MADGYGALTEKEKETLRLIVRGHDAKSTARHLNLSVHTINERLRDARRKLSVSSSREAARLLLAREGGIPQLLGDQQIGDAPAPTVTHQPPLPENGGGRPRRHAWLAAGVALMSLVLGLLAVATVPQVAPADPPPAAAASADTTTRALDDAARRWLALVDQGRWQESWAAAGTSFRTLNTAQLWTSVSEKVRTPLGAVQSRTLLDHETLLAPPHGYEVVRFRTDFANKRGATETVSLFREGDAWRVVGVLIE